MRYDVWKDPDVKAAMKKGRTPEDIAVLSCPQCGHYSYYNQGSHFYCKFCKKGYYCCSENEEPPDDLPWIRLGEHTTLADTVYEYDWDSDDAT